MNQELRQTGRTQRMLEAALKLVGEGQSVTIVSNTKMQGHDLKRQLMNMIAETTDMRITDAGYDMFSVGKTYVTFSADEYAVV